MMQEQALGEKKRRLGKGAFGLEEKACGVHLNPCSMLALTSLVDVFGPITSLRYDPMHAYFSNGLVQQELWHFMCALDFLRRQV